MARRSLFMAIPAHSGSSYGMQPVPSLGKIERVQVISCIPSTRGLNVVIGDEPRTDRVQGPTSPRASSLCFDRTLEARLPAFDTVPTNGRFRLRFWKSLARCAMKAGARCWSAAVCAMS